MCYARHMRVHIDMEATLVERIDEAVGTGRRSQFVRDAVSAALRQRERVTTLRSAKASIGDRDHPWDADPAAWSRAQRRGDERRLG